MVSSQSKSASLVKNPLAATSTRPIQLVVPFSAGGGLDLNARYFAQSVAETLKQPVAVTNRNGAAGTIGLQAVASSKPDGYTVAFTPAVPLSSEPHRLKSLAYQLDSFKYVCQVPDNIFVAAVPKDSSYQSIQDIVKDARRNAGMGSATAPPTSRR